MACQLTQQQAHNRTSAGFSDNSDYGLTNPHSSKITIELLQVFQMINSSKKQIKLH